MSDLELDSFYVKFKNLLYSGKDANLTLKSEAGKASVILSLDLGPVHGGHGHLFQQRSRNGPSRQRRREKRAADRAVKEHEEALNQELAEEATDNVEKTSKTVNDLKTTVEIDAEEVSGEVSPKKITSLGLEEFAENEKIGANDEHDAEKASHKETGKANDTFKCPICDFESTWERGLSIHMGVKHSNIEQLDGHNDELEDENRYENTKHYWEKGRIGVIYHTFLDANYLLDNSGLPTDEKKEEKLKLLDARKAAFGKTYYNFPPWKK